MIYIACAMYREAEPLIRRFECKTDPSFRRQQVFSGEDALIIVTGTSPVPAAAALAGVLALREPGESDVFANVGLCGCSGGAFSVGTVCLAKSITEQATGRRFFPDLLFRRTCALAPLITYSTVVESTKDIPSGSLFDTEAAGLYQAALPFFSTDRLLFLKIVSDSGDDASSVTPQTVSALTEQNADCIADTLRRFADNYRTAPAESESNRDIIDYFCRSLRCSVTMELELRRLIDYCEMAYGDVAPRLRAFFAEHGLNFEENVILGSRKEGKDVLEQFRRSCL